MKPIDPLDRQQKKLAAKGMAPKPMTKSEERAAHALAAARGRPSQAMASTIRMLHSGGKENPLHPLGRIRRGRGSNDLTGRGTSLSHVRRRIEREEDSDLLEEREREEREAMERSDAIARLELAKPLPQDILRPKPRGKLQE